MEVACGSACESSKESFKEPRWGASADGDLSRDDRGDNEDMFDTVGDRRFLETPRTSSLTDQSRAVGGWWLVDVLSITTKRGDECSGVAMPSNNIKSMNCSCGFERV